ncbi:hypothetical protein M501DRAFT_933956 [Patellaria atrata CBS 101060]|uniref:protein-histidine N-methyltransferase n=1 Tax=Patellaria atrata CBS 101060 TaxID=1346257 RepID=A0A9P4SB62_9PEZI|nr:hypothetical protein M501DRAFT_933956 [Patellaria atrata CBS 101060]
MSVQFSFGFSGDDIEEEDVTEVEGDGERGEGAAVGVERNGEGEVQRVEACLSSLPSKISYSTLKLESPKGRKLSIPRRELFDIRMQLMVEDGNDDSTPVTGLDESDIQTNVYEGGFKSWECSIDLAKLLLDRGPRKDIDDLCRVDHVIELGCGTAVPSLVLFHYALTQELSIHFTLADYNAAVLRLVTLPNLLLMWAKTMPTTTTSPFSSENPNPLLENAAGDLELSPEILSAFQKAVTTQNLALTLISGSWMPTTRFLPLVVSAPDMNTLVLASETIYSPASLSAFTEVLVGILERVRIGKAMVAAKRIYFGVGGSVDAFKEEAAAKKAVAYEIENAEVGGGMGVKRCLMEVQMM